METKKAKVSLLKTSEVLRNGTMFTRDAVEDMLKKLPLQSLAGYVKLADDSDATVFVKDAYLEGDMLMAEIEYFENAGNVLKTNAAHSVLNVEEFDIGVAGSTLLSDSSVIKEFNLFMVSLVKNPENGCELNSPEPTPTLL